MISSDFSDINIKSGKQKPLPNERHYWGKIYRNLPKLDLIAIQKDSYREFLEKEINELLAEISPIEDFTSRNWELIFDRCSLGKPKYSPLRAMRKGVTFEIPLRVKVALLNKRNGYKSEKEVFLGNVPEMTERGTFVINGIERAVINQIVRSPGVFFFGGIDKISGRTLYYGEIRPIRGSWLEFFVNRNDTISVRIDRRRKFPITVLLRAFSLASDEEILNIFPLGKERERKYLIATLESDPTKNREEALLEIYQKIRPGEPAILENARQLLDNMFFDYRRYNLGRVGRYKINKRLGLNIPNSPKSWVISQDDLVAALRYLIDLQNGEGYVDDIDHLSNRRVRCVGELVSEIAFRPGLLRLERSIKERMSLVSTDERVIPTQLINARPLTASLNSFFRTSQVSAILDQTNPLSEIDNLRRLTVMGPGGITRERASFSIRDINASQYGRICPIRSPEGPNIGLVTYLSLYTRVNEYGFLESPYFRVVKQKIDRQTRMMVTNEIVYLQADDEQKYHITYAGINVDEKGVIRDSWLPARYKGQFLEVPAEKVDFIDVSPVQVVGTSASLIPFLAHDEANRALMGTHMQCQAVPLVKPQAPIVGTGMESLVAEAMGRVARARHSGVVEWIDARKVVVKLDEKSRKKITTEKIEPRENIKIEKDRETYLVNKFTRSAQSTCYSQKPVVSVGDKVKEGDLLIDGPACESGELSLGQNLLIAYCSIDGLGYEDAIVISDRLVKDDFLTSIYIEEYETPIVETKLGPEELTRDIPNVGEQDLANLDENGIIVVGSEVGPNDILVGKIAPKGETELTAEEKLLRAIFGEKAREVRDVSLRIPHGERGTVVDVQILDRDKGDELEPGTIREVIVKVAQIRKVTVGDKLAGRHGNKGVISKIVPVADMPYLTDGTPVDIIISPLSVLARMNLGQLLEAHLGWAASRLGYKAAIPVFEKVSEDKLKEELEKAGLPRDGKVVLCDGRTGESLAQNVVVGMSYILKLIHMVEDKIHARSTGPYSLVTQQPLGGKAQMGGQRLGEMEVWALESHRAAHTLQEMLTFKSDDVIGRAKTFEAIVKGTSVPEPTVPESFKVLVKELNSLGLEIIPTGAVKEKKEEDEEE
ncbi:MAG TPA: DNA-directed RNA polymerase subunit beta [Candidatus Bathyarchaeia archaeon]|nr:DNA-directed RNA polymerase subunit beta [Candidatus Bathyarchaeia archaeon]